MLITTFFTDQGIPKAGLTPVINIVDADAITTIVSSDAMIEIGSGWYKYEFVAFNENKNYVIKCDGGSELWNDSERYTYAVNEKNGLLDNQLNIIEDTNTKVGTIPADVWSVDKTTITTPDSIGEYILKKVLNLARFIGFSR